MRSEVRSETSFFAAGAFKKNGLRWEQRLESIRFSCKHLFEDQDVIDFGVKNFFRKLIEI